MRLSFLLVAAALALAMAARGQSLPGTAQADARLNQTYQALQRSLNPQAAAQVKAVQRAWVAFKERDFPIFSRLAVQANDRPRIDAYESEETDARTVALTSLAAGRDLNQRNSRERELTAAEADQMLNSLYRECLRVLPTAQLAGFKETQSLWLQFRDQHVRLAAAGAGRSEDYVLRNLTMNRVIQFRHYMMVLLAAQLPESDAEPEEPEARGKANPISALDVYRFAR